MAMITRRQRERITGALAGIAVAALLLAGCAGGPATAPDAAVELPSDAGAAAHTRVVDAARAMLGEPYRYGGERPGGFDCSGLVRYAHARAGVAVPRTVRQQLAAARRVSPGALRPGDLIFFELGDKPAHVGIVVEGRRFVHAPSSGSVVRTDSLEQDYWRRRFLAAGRLTGS